MRWQEWGPAGVVLKRVWWWQSSSTAVMLMSVFYAAACLQQFDSPVQCFIMLHHSTVNWANTIKINQMNVIFTKKNQRMLCYQVSAIRGQQVSVALGVFNGRSRGSDQVFNKKKSRPTWYDETCSGSVMYPRYRNLCFKSLIHNMKLKRKLFYCRIISN